MDDNSKVDLIVENLKGKTFTFQTKEGRPFEDLMMIDVKRKEGYNLIFVGKEKSVGLFMPLILFSVVKEETESGWVAGDVICGEVMINGVPFLQFTQSLFVGRTDL